jgi:hypothetical protein
MGVKLGSRTYRCAIVFQHKHGCHIGATHQSQPQRLDAVINMLTIHLMRSVELFRHHRIIVKPGELTDEVLIERTLAETHQSKSTAKLTRQ